MEWLKLASCRIDHSWTCEIDPPWREKPKCSFIRKLAIDEPFAICCYVKDSHNCSNRSSPTLHTPISHHSCPLPKPYDAQNSKCSFPLSFMQHPTIPNKVCNPSSLNLLHETTWPMGGDSFQLKQTLIFLFNTGRLLNFPFTSNWKWSCVNAPLCSMEHKPTMHSSWMYFLNLKRRPTLIFIPPTAIVTDTSKHLREKSLGLVNAQAHTCVEPWQKKEFCSEWWSKGHMIRIFLIIPTTTIPFGMLPCNIEGENEHGDQKS